MLSSLKNETPITRNSSSEKRKKNSNSGFSNFKFEKNNIFGKNMILMYR